MIARTSLNLVLVALVATVLLAAAPAFAAAPPATGAPAPAPAVQPAVVASLAQPALGAGCSRQPELLPALALPGQAAEPARLAGPVCSLESANPLPLSRPFHGFCACSCTHIPNCNTSADCGGGACLPGITCC